MEMIYEKKLKSVISTTTDAFASTDAQGLITDWNLSGERIFGWKREELLGKKMVEMLLTKESQDEVIKVFEAYLSNGQDENLGKLMEVSAVKKDGSTIIVEMVIGAFKMESDHHFNIFIRDINARKLLEINLKRSNQELLGREKEALQAVRYIEKALEDRKHTQVQLLQSEKMASIGQLAAGIAHEINNPVGFISNNMEMLEQYAGDYNKIIVMANLLKEAVEAQDIEKAKAISQGIAKFEEEVNLDFVIKDISILLQHNLRGIERIRKIVADLRTFAREDTEAMDLVRIEEVIDSILGIVNNEIKYKAELKKEYGPTPMIQCASQRIGQVLINLLVNASQAILEKGTILIKTYAIEGFVCIDITDTGSGIKEENLKKIFDPFFTTKPVGQGTGLGLSISYGIIKKHGGQIKVSSKIGQGTTFTIMLPTVKETGASK